MRPLKRQLQNYLESARCANQKKLALLFIEKLQSSLNIFDRDHMPGHFTASCWLWNKQKSHVLFTLHKKLERWLPLGGHADGESDLLIVALNEAKEESGIEEIQAISSNIIQLGHHSFPSSSKNPKHDHYNVFYELQVTHDVPYVVSDESIDLKWIEPHQLEAYNTEEVVLEMRDKLTQNLIHPSLK